MTETGTRVGPGCSLPSTGSHAARFGNRFEALKPARQIVLRQFGASKDVTKDRALRHDTAPAIFPRFPGRDRLSRLQSSPSFVRYPEGNRVAEHFTVR